MTNERAKEYNSHWTPNEDAALVDGFNCSYSLSTIARGIGRSYSAVATRAGMLRLRHPVKDRRGRKKPDRQLQLTSILQSAGTSRWLKNNTHPRHGEPVSPETRRRISEANKGKVVPPETTERAMKTKYARYGSVAGNFSRGSWKGGWREVGGKRIYARSRWEANYARYLELLKTSGEIAEWEHEPERFGSKKSNTAVVHTFPTLGLQS